MHLNNVYRFFIQFVDRFPHKYEMYHHIGKCLLLREYLCKSCYIQQWFNVFLVDDDIEDAFTFDSLFEVPNDARCTRFADQLHIDMANYVSSVGRSCPFGNTDEFRWRKNPQTTETPGLFHSYLWGAFNCTHSNVYIFIRDIYKYSLESLSDCDLPRKMRLCDIRIGLSISSRLSKFVCNANHIIRLEFLSKLVLKLLAFKLYELTFSNLTYFARLLSHFFCPRYTFRQFYCEMVTTNSFHVVDNKHLMRNAFFVLAQWISLLAQAHGAAAGDMVTAAAAVFNSI